MMKKQTLKNNWLSLLSLAVALSALFYNTWRNEQTELNRNYRASGFEIVREIAKLQLLVDQTFYAPESNNNAIEGWTRINFIQSLSAIMPSSVKQRADDLKLVWSEQWQQLNEKESANKLITEANRALEQEVLIALKRLD